MDRERLGPVSAPSPEHPIRILAVDDHPLLREGIASILEIQPDMVLVGEASDGAEALAQFRALRPDVTLMDLQMPGMDGVEVLAAIRAEYPKARVIMLTTYAGDAHAARALKAGAAGYLLKNTLRKELLETIRSVHAGRRRVASEVAEEMALHATEDPLSSREIEVLRLVAAGKANKEVAWQLGIAEDTVKAHLKSIFSKLDVADRTHAVTLAIQRGIL